MSNEFKLVPGIWHPISAINEGNRYEHSFLLHCPDLISSDFNPSGVVEGHWCDDEGWQAAVWCGYHDEFHTKFVTPTLIMTIPSIAAPQPPALGGAPEVFGLIYRVNGEVVLEPVGDPHIKDGMPVYSAECLAPLQAEIEQLKYDLGTCELMRDIAYSERDQVKARCDELEHRAADVVEGFDGEQLPGSMTMRIRKLKYALSKPAGSEKV